MAKKQFKTESKKLLDLMINSIYTHKEIFLRELISNASDALDKLYFKSLTDSSLKRDFAILIELDNKNRTITISDNGIGMTKDELDKNLGTIAKSGSLDFKTQNKKDDIDIIGQFGVGFYSAFMVAKRVTVYTKSFDSNTGFKWVSSGVDGYSIDEMNLDFEGTKIVLDLKDDNDKENYSEFLDEFKIKSLIKKYSNYIRYPIKMECTKTREKKDYKEGDSQKFETYKEIDTLNNMIPIWKKDKKDLKEDELNSFYKEKFGDYSDPMKVIHSKTEGSATYSALLFIPSQTPFNYYSKDYEKGLELYSSGVLIMEKCPQLLPDYFNFVKGLVDSEDLSLNISRETLQHDRQLLLIKKSLEKKIKNELLNLLNKDRDKYDEFFKNFGLQLKYGVYADFGAYKDECSDLIMFYSSFEDKYTTLKEYVSRMKSEQKEILYACGSSINSISSMPQMESVLDHNLEVLYLTENIDEFALKMLASYDGKPFKNIADNDLKIDSESENEIKEITDKNSELLKFIKESLKDKVVDVKLSNRLKTGAVCLSTSSDMSIEMEKVLNAIPNSQNVKANRVLEINHNHKIFKKLVSLFENNKDKVKDYAEILFNEAALIEGIPPENPAQYSNKIFDLLS